MFNFTKWSSVLNTIKHTRNLTNSATSNISSIQNKNVISLLDTAILNNEISSPKQMLIPSTSTNPIISDYKCPSLKNFQFPMNDFKITDNMRRQELNLPELDKKKIVYDPLLIFQVGIDLPNESTNVKNPMHCGRPLFSEKKWRSRKMNKKKKRKYEKKMFYVKQKRLQAKEKRYQSLLQLFKEIQEKKTELFDPKRMINRELEKAKFFGYKCSNVYDQYRDAVNTMNSFDSKYFTKFEERRKPYHLLDPYKDDSVKPIFPNKTKKQEEN